MTERVGLSVIKCEGEQEWKGMSEWDNVKERQGGLKMRKSERGKHGLNEIDREEGRERKKEEKRERERERERKRDNQSKLKNDYNRFTLFIFSAFIHYI